MKSKIFNYVEQNRNDLVDMATYIFNNPELAFKEVKAANFITNYLEKQGFLVERAVGGIDTAFRAVYRNLEGGPTIGLLCEYDALAKIGHACAHHLQAPSIVGAADAIKALYKNKPFELVVYGTPAEEGGGGKVLMLDKGCFKELDLALMMHGGPETTTDVKSLAVTRLEVTFHGKSAHAAIKPEDGRSALDAILLTFNAIEFLREHVRDDVRMHYTILNAGGPANVVQAKAVASISLRSYSSSYLETVVKRVQKILEGACLMTETTLEVKRNRGYKNKIPVFSLNDVLLKNAREVNAPNITKPREKTGSTDFGDVMYEIPGSCIRVAFIKQGTSSHSQEYVEAGLSEDAMNAMIYGAKILAGSVFDILEEENLLESIQEEFRVNKAKHK